MSELLEQKNGGKRNQQDRRQPADSRQLFGENALGGKRSRQEHAQGLARSLFGNQAGGVNRHQRRKTWAKPVLKRVPGIEHDLDRNPLDNLGEVSRGIVGRQKSEL